MAEAARLQAWVDKYGASATKASAAQSRVKMIEKMRKEGKLDPPAVGLTVKRHKPSLVLPDPPKAIGEELLVLKGADIGYEEEGMPILEGIDLVVNRGMKLILRGPNGAGEHSEEMCVICFTLALCADILAIIARRQIHVIGRTSRNVAPSIWKAYRK